jgi:uncharacterized membrane protein YqjE
MANPDSRSETRPAVGVFGALFVTLFVVMLVWDTQYRLVAVGGFALLYLAAGVIAGLMTRQKSRDRGPLLSATLAELAKDCQRLSS